MNLKARFFKKPWQSKDPAARAQAVRVGSDPELKAELPRLAQHDESAEVRLAALKRINTEPFWLDARLREQDVPIRTAADAFLSREVVKSADEGLRESRLQWLAGIEQAEVIRRIAKESPDPALRRAALARVDAQGFLGDCFGSESDDELAGEILQRIDQPSTLERLSEQLRKQSKKRSQAAAARLRTILIERGELAQDQTEANTLVSEVEALARGQGEGDRASRLEQLLERWSALSDPPEAQTRRFEGAVKIIQSSLNRDPAERPKLAPTAEATAEAPAADAALLKAAEHIREVIRKADKSIAAAELLGDWDRAWNAIGSPSEPDQSLKHDMLPLLKELQAQIVQAQVAKNKAASDSEQSKPVNQLSPLLDQIAEALESGDIGKSHELIRKARGRFNALPGRQRPREAGGRLQRMEGRLKEMRDYQHWSHNEHRDELIAQVEAIPGSGQHPDAISAILKQAREEWQRLETLEILPGDRRRFASPAGQWRRFQAACKNAFDTAKPYFEKRQEVQTENLELLDRFIASGRAMLNEDAPNPAQLRDLMVSARAAIRRMDDLPPKSRGQSAARLRELMDQVSSKQNALFEEIELVKRRLISEAKALVHEKDNKAAIDKAKALQAQWKKTGSGRRKLDQKLWEEFRAPIDPLFEQLKGEREEQKQAEHEVQAALRALCEQAEALAKVDDQELDNAAGRMAGLSAEWAGSEGRSPKLNQRFEKAQSALEKRLLKRKEQQRQADRARRESLAETVQALAAARLDQPDKELGSELPEARADDSEMDRALCERAALLANADFSAAALADLIAQGDEQARQLVVEIEFLAGLETPDDDRQRRMDYQVQRLARRMSERQSQPDLATELDELTVRWFQSLPHSPQLHAGLAKRFAAGRKILEDMIGR